MADYIKLKPFILRWEGGYVNDPLDRGGATNKGVTLATFKQVYGSNKTAEDLKQMTEAQWNHIFKKFYWDRWRADEINSQSVANIVVDWVWASGIHGIKRVQRLLGVVADGIVGTKTLTALNSQDSKTLFDRIKEDRIVFVNNIVLANPPQKRFLKGWLNRINSIKYED